VFTVPGFSDKLSVKSLLIAAAVLTLSFYVIPIAICLAAILGPQHDNARVF
jgi:hypothetical protein